MGGSSENVASAGADLLFNAPCRSVCVPAVLAHSRSDLSSLASPSAAAKPPSGAGRLHEIKLDGFRLMAQRRGVGGRLLHAQRQRLDRTLSVRSNE